MNVAEKYQILQEKIREMGSVAVAFSGGVDSTFLMKVAHDVLGDQAIAVTASSVFIPDRELREAREFCAGEGIAQVIRQIDILGNREVAQNPPDRCYICKKEIFGELIRVAKENGMNCVAEGSNMDDQGDYRPGLRAIRELAIRSPLQEAELTKAEIRQLSKELGLPTWEKPSFACLASRFVYGESLDEKSLRMVDQGEQLMLELGFAQFRVRIHGNLARIEVLPEDMEKAIQHREEIAKKLKSYGFSYVTLDLLGYRTGSMNEVLTEVSHGQHE